MKKRKPTLPTFMRFTTKRYREDFTIFSKRWRDWHFWNSRLDLSVIRALLFYQNSRAEAGRLKSKDQYSISAFKFNPHLKSLAIFTSVSFERQLFEVGLDINFSSIELGIFKIRGLNCYSLTFLLKVINIVRKYSNTVHLASLQNREVINLVI